MTVCYGVSACCFDIVNSVVHSPVTAFVFCVFYFVVVSFSGVSVYGCILFAVGGVCFPDLLLCLDECRFLVVLWLVVFW